MLAVVVRICCCPVFSSVRFTAKFLIIPFQSIAGGWFQERVRLVDVTSPTDTEVGELDGAKWKD